MPLDYKFDIKHISNNFFWICHSILLIRSSNLVRKNVGDMRKQLQEILVDN